MTGQQTGPTSPEGTGGLGHHYESATVAAYLAAMVAGSNGPGLQGVVAEVALQQRASGRPLDDLVVRWRDDLGRDGTLDLQLKHQLALTAANSNTDFAAIVVASWQTIQLSDFVEGHDRAGAATERISTDSLYECQRIGDMARLSADGAALSAALLKLGHLGRAGRTVRDAVSSILGRHFSRAPTPDELLRFWRHFVVLRVETTGDRFADRARAIDQLRIVTSDPLMAGPRQVFSNLESLASQLNVRAATVNRAQVLQLLHDRFGTTIELLSPELEVSWRATRAAAKIDIAAWLASIVGNALAPQFALIASEAEQGKATRFGLDGFEARIRASRSMTIFGEPGAGKSLALAQIADHLLTNSDLVGIVGILPLLAESRQPIMDAICNRSPFGSVAREALERVADAGRLVLFLDGWNELGATQRNWAFAELADLRRLHLNILLVVASRSGSVIPFVQGDRVEILPFDRERQFQAAKRLLGDAGHEILIRARARPALRPLLRTPLFLSAILRQGAEGELPSDRETAIARLVELGSGTPARQDRLRTALDGQHMYILETIAWGMMEAETTLLPAHQVNLHVAAALSALREQGLVQSVSSQAATDLLIAHHLLVTHLNPEMQTIGFQHQLLQEWFASRRIDGKVERLVSGAMDRELLTLLNAPFWSVAFLFSVERLARRGSEIRSQLQCLVYAALGVDPMLAADIVTRSSHALGDSLDGHLLRFADAWTDEDAKRALSFKLASGRSIFAPELWKALQESREFVFDLHRGSFEFPLTALESDWDTEFPKLTAESRRILLADIADLGEAAGLTGSSRLRAAKPATTWCRRLSPIWMPGKNVRTSRAFSMASAMTCG